MSIEGVYGFVYSGMVDFGFGFCHIGDGAIVGHDVGGGRYEGTVVEQEDGRFRLLVDFHVPAGGGLVQGVAPQDVPSIRKLDFTLSSAELERVPVTIAAPPGTVWVVFHRLPENDNYVRMAKAGIRIEFGPAD